MDTAAYAELFEQEPTHWWYRGMREITYKLLAPALPNPNSGSLKILDAGCGVGGNLTPLSQWGIAYGIDYSALALTYALQAQADQVGCLMQASVHALPYAEASFDVITSFDVLYCREVQDDRQALAELARVLRPGGVLLIRLPALTMLRGHHDEVVHGIRRYTAAELRQMLQDVGLLPQRTTYANTVLMPLIYVFRRLQSLVIRFRSSSTPPSTVSASDVRPTPHLLNELLFRLLFLEARWIGGGHSLPFGVSVIGVASKPVTEPPLKVKLRTKLSQLA